MSKKIFEKLLTPGKASLVSPVRYGAPLRVEISMNAHILEDAAKVITEPQVLINMVSRRVRQLSAGSRPMVEVGARMGLADIALSEIAQGKVGVAPVIALKL